MKKIVFLLSAVLLVCVLFVSCDDAINSDSEGTKSISFTLVNISSAKSASLSTGDGENTVKFSQLSGHKIKLICTDGSGYCSLSGAKDGFVSWPTSSVQLGYGTWIVCAQGYKTENAVDVVYYQNTTGVTFLVGPKGVSTDSGATWGSSVSITESYCNTSAAKIKVNSSLTVKNESDATVTLGSEDYDDYQLKWYKTTTANPTNLTTARTVSELSATGTGFTEWTSPTTAIDAGSNTYVVVAIVDNTTSSTIFGSASVKLENLSVGQVYTLGSGSSDYVQFGKYGVKFDTPTEELITKGIASVLESSGRKQSEWVQLWEDGPKFAKFFVGSSIESYKGVTSYDEENIGGYYCWGGSRSKATVDECFLPSEGEEGTLPSEFDTATVIWGNNWRMPTESELRGLYSSSKTIWTVCTGEEGNQYVEGCTLAGWKVSGKVGTPYENKCIFLPISGVWRSSSRTLENVGSFTEYRGSTYSPEENGATKFHIVPHLLLKSDYHGSGGSSFICGNGFPVRAVLAVSNNGQIEGSAATNHDANRENDSCEWVQLWEGGPCFAAFNIGATIDDYANATNYEECNVGGYYDWGGTKSKAVVEECCFEACNEYGKNYGRFPDDYDTAKELWGTNWRMLSDQEFYQLKNNADWEWCSGENGSQYEEGCTLKGYKVSGKTGSVYENNSIFIPASGHYTYNALTKFSEVGKYCFVWSNRTRNPNNIKEAYFLQACDSDYKCSVSDNFHVSHGLTVLAVIDE